MSPSATPFAAILFDNDGVLVDTEGLYFQANREALARFGVALDRDSYVDLFLCASRGAWDLLRRAPGCPARAVSRRRGLGARVARRPSSGIQSAHLVRAVVEDSERGLRAAKAAGLACWIVPSALTRGGAFEAADAVLEDFAAVVRRLGAGGRA